MEIKRNNKITQYVGNRSKEWSTYLGLILLLSSTVFGTELDQITKEINALVELIYAVSVALVILPSKREENIYDNR